MIKKKLSLLQIKIIVLKVRILEQSIFHKGTQNQLKVMNERTFKKKILGTSKIYTLTELGYNGLEMFPIPKPILTLASLKFLDQTSSNFFLSNDFNLLKKNCREIDLFQVYCCINVSLAWHKPNKLLFIHNSIIENTRGKGKN